MQTKEKLITSLQAGSGGVSGPTQEVALEQLQLEKEAIEMELDTARLQGAGLREELQEIEDQHSREMEQLTEQVSSLFTTPYNNIVLCIHRYMNWRVV